MSLRLAWLFSIALLLASPAAYAHKPSDSYLRLNATGASIAVQWDIALRDLEFAIGLDANADGAITWGELRRHKDDVGAYALSRLRIAADGAACTPGEPELLVDEHSDGTYAVLKFAAACPAAPSKIALSYRLFFDLDAQHRGLLNMTGAAVGTAVLSPEQPDAVFSVSAPPHGILGQFVPEGIRHILGGIDHLFFIVVLLLPAMFRREGRRWQPIDSFPAAALEAVKILTAFTVAHAVTLTLAVTGYVTLPSRLVESAIALTIILTAIDNLYPVFVGRRWAVAFGFGLVHGIGFATVLTPLALSSLQLALALVGFNIGIEAGQLMIAVALLPLGYLLRDWRLYSRGILPVGSLAAMLVACLWFVDRAFQIALVPF